jgi:hypothetical protein
VIKVFCFFFSKKKSLLSRRRQSLAEKYPSLVLQLAERWTAWAAASDVDQWDDAFDTGHTRHRQNWGSYEVPRLPQASDQVQSD